MRGGKNAALGDTFSNSWAAENAFFDFYEAQPPHKPRIPKRPTAGPNPGIQGRRAWSPRPFTTARSRLLQRPPSSCVVSSQREARTVPSAAEGQRLRDTESLHQGCEPAVNTGLALRFTNCPLGAPRGPLRTLVCTKITSRLERTSPKRPVFSMGRSTVLLFLPLYFPLFPAVTTHYSENRKQETFVHRKRLGDRDQLFLRVLGRLHANGSIPSQAQKN